MIAIQSFRSDKIRSALESFGGPELIKDSIVKMALSAVTVARHYPEFHYITDDAGMYMAMQCKLPYTKIESVGENFTSNSAFEVHNRLLAYQCNQPFLHFSNDVFLWDPLPETAHTAEVLAFCGESFLWPVYEESLSQLKEAVAVPDLTSLYFANRTPLNMTVFGGTNTAAINEYSKEVLKIVSDLNGFNGLDNNALDLVQKSNKIFEQLWASYIIQSKLGVKVSYLKDEKDLYYNKQNSDLKLTHLPDMAQQLEKNEVKRIETIRRLHHNLNQINPEVYKAVQDFTSSPNNIDKLMELV